MKKFEDALAFAEEAHKWQFRTKGKDKGIKYIVHPKRVADKETDPIRKQAAILHDVVEDGIINGRRVTEEFLLDYGFDPKVVEIVEDLTRKEGETYFDFIMRIKDKPDSAKVKILDIEDNMVSLDEGSLKDKYRLAHYILKNAVNG